MNKKTVVAAFGRMNPPTAGHMKLIDAVHSIADKEGIDHNVITSGTVDAKTNPLSTEQKLKHLSRYSGKTNFTAADKSSPTILHHLARLHGEGYENLIYVSGSDRVEDMDKLINKYNGIPSKHGYYNFKQIEVRSAGHRDPQSTGTEGISGTKMREFAKNNDFKSFKQGVPVHISNKHSRELMNDVRVGMNIKESYIQKFLNKLRLF